MRRSRCGTRGEWRPRAPHLPVHGRHRHPPGIALHVEPPLQSIALVAAPVGSDDGVEHWSARDRACRWLRR
eukprot:2839309-Prymnesium_polylepis.1